MRVVLVLQVIGFALIASRRVGEVDAHRPAGLADATDYPATDVLLGAKPMAVPAAGRLAVDRRDVLDANMGHWRL
jgi:hypothetical protein